MWKSIYDGVPNHPGVAFAAGLLVLLLIVIRRPRLAFLGALLEGEILLDALFTGPLSPLREGALSGALAIAFVVLGDLRFFYLVWRQRTVDRLRALLVALPCAAVVPIVASGAQRLFPGLLPSPRHLFLLYEVLFACGALAFGAWAGRGIVPQNVARWVRGLVGFEVLQYAGWALADLLIFAEGDVGYAVRLVPNVLYYAAFVPFAILTAPEEARG
jgi:hypothetical protein